MRVRYHVATSADGFIAATDGSYGWLNDFPEGETGFDAFIASIEGIVVGRTTFDQALSVGEWHFGNTPCVVLSSRELTGDVPACAMRCDGTPEEALAMLASAGVQGDVWHFGGAKCAASFLRAGLIDTIEFAVLPVVLGEGISALGSIGAPRRMKLLSHTVVDHGMQWVTYGVEEI